MKTKLTKLHVYGAQAAPPAGYRHAVSLHCHTQCSKELLTFIPHYAAHLPLLGPLYRSEMARYEREYGKTVDYGRLWWTPPFKPWQGL